jgi:hypothetical protein
MFCGFGLNIESMLLSNNKNIQKEKVNLIKTIEKVDRDYADDKNIKRRLKRLSNLNTAHNFSSLFNRLELVKI